MEPDRQQKPVRFLFIEEMIKALIFDFDGLILDTETTDFRVWQSIYREYGQEMLPETWGQVIGGYGISNFDGAVRLAELVGAGVDVEGLRTRFRSESDALILQQPVMPGVVDYLNDAQGLGLRLAIASSSPHSWVDMHLARLGLADRFDLTVCGDDVPPGRTKPHPDLFLKTLATLNVETHEAIIFEDSPNGISAALAAGIFVVRVPNPITALLKTEKANLTLDSLAQIPLQKMLNDLALL
jgi:HAD superfamily hydrolase (TIGR01509 family)